MTRHLLLPLAFSLLTGGAAFAQDVIPATNTPSPETTELLSLCAGCHGATGVSADGAFPNLAGQKREYLVKQLQDFRAQTRADPVMGPVAEPLDDTAIDGLAAFFSGQSPVE